MVFLTRNKLFIGLLLLLNYFYINLQNLNKYQAQTAVSFSQQFKILRTFTFMEKVAARQLKRL